MKNKDFGLFFCPLLNKKVYRHLPLSGVTRLPPKEITPMALTDTAIRSVKPRDKPAELFDGGGLVLLVAPNGGKWWRLKYRFGRKASFPGRVSSHQPQGSPRAPRRGERTDCHGHHPGANIKAGKEAVRAEAVNSFEVVAREWHDKQKDTLVKSHGDKIFARFVNDIFPIIGAKAAFSDIFPVS